MITTLRFVQFKTWLVRSHNDGSLKEPLRKENSLIDKFAFETFKIKWFMYIDGVSISKPSPTYNNLDIIWVTKFWIRRDFLSKSTALFQIPILGIFRVRWI